MATKVGGVWAAVITGETAEAMGESDSAKLHTIPKMVIEFASPASCALCGRLIVTGCQPENR